MSAEQTARYRRLPTGSHGLDPELVKDDQRQRLQQAMIELIAEKGYPSVRIVDLAKLAHVSQPTFYSLFSDKEDLFLSAYDQVAQRAAYSLFAAFNGGPQEDRLNAAMRAFTELAAAEPEAVSLLVLGAFGAGTGALAQRRRRLAQLERTIAASRPADDREEGSERDGEDLTVKAILGGIREVVAARLRAGRAHELPAIAEELSRWAACYPTRLPVGLEASPACAEASTAGRGGASERARRAEGRLPSGRSDLPRQFIVNSQRERIVDATAAIVAEEGLAALTIPKIARRANVSHQTFYDNYRSKHDAFLGALKVGMHQALRMSVDAYEQHAGDWPRAIRAGAEALVRYLVSEPAHAHLTLVDTFAASPEAIEIRSEAMAGFAHYLAPGYELAGEEREVPAIAAEAIAGGVWQVLYHYIENDCAEELLDTVPLLTYFALTPFLGAQEATDHAALERA